MKVMGFAMAIVGVGLAVFGIAGVGTVTSVEETGMLINDNPRCRIHLNVTLPGRAVYQATITAVIPQVALATYQPGTAYDVRVDPEDLASVVIVDTASLSLDAGPAALSAGLPAMATVREVLALPSGIAIDGPLWGLALRIKVDDGRPVYERRLATSYPPGTSQPRRGQQLAVRVTPDDPFKIAVDWTNAPVQRSDA